MPITTRSALVGAGIDALIGVALFSIFSFLRIARASAKFYSPRRYEHKDEVLPGHPTADAPKPPRLPSTLLSWMVPVWRLSEEQVIACAGYDVAAHLRLIRFGLHLFLVVAVWALAVILPINMTGREVDRLIDRQTRTADGIATGGLDPSDAAGSGLLLAQPPPNSTTTYIFTDIDRLSLSNIAPGSPRLWAHLVSVYFTTFVTLLLLWSYSRDSVNLQLRYLSSSPPGGPSHTVLVTDIPGLVYGTPLAAAYSVIHTTVLRFLPAAAKRPIERAWHRAYGAPAAGPMPAQPETATTVLLAASVGSDGAASSSGGLAQAWVRPLETAVRRQGKATGEGSAHGADRQGLQGLQPADGARRGVLEQRNPNGSGAAERGAPPPAGTPPLRPSPPPEEQQQPGQSQTPLRVRGGGGGGGDGGGSDVDAGEQDWNESQDQARLQRMVRDAALDVDAWGGVAGGAWSAGLPRGREWLRMEALLRQGVPLEDLVWSQFDDAFGPQQVAAVHLVRDTRTLEQLGVTYTAAVQNLEDLLDEYELLLAKATTKRFDARQHGSRTMAPSHTVHMRKERIVPPLYGSWGLQRFGPAPVSVDALTFRREWVLEVALRVRREQLAAAARPVPTAFVTFKSRWMQAAAVAAPLTSNQAAWVTTAAPPPDGVLWRSLRMRLWERFCRAAIVRVAVAVLVLTYVVPVSAVQALLQVNRLDNLPVISSIMAIPVVRSLVLAVLPGLALRLFVVLAPALLYVLNRRAGLVSSGDVDFNVTTQYFLLQVATVFLATFISGSLLNQVTQLVDDPKSILGVLGGGVPQTASFFIMYLLFTGLIGRPFALLRLPGLLMYLVRSASAATARARRRVWTSQYRLFGPFIPDITVTLLLGLVFAAIQPLVVVAVLLWLAVSNVEARYQQVWVFRRPYESGGRLWRQVFVQVMTGLYLSQLVMLGLLGVKRFVYAPLLLPCIAATLAFQVAAGRLLWAGSQALSLRTARQLDQRDKEATRDADGAELGGEDGGRLYVAPGFTLFGGDAGRGDLDALVLEAEAMERRLREFNAAAAGQP